MSAPTRRVRVIIEGKVQGVWYRGWTVETAMSLGLDGWVRNRHDGGVEAVISGSAREVEEMLDRCRQGPPAARVVSVTVIEWHRAASPGFLQLPTE